MLRVFERHRRFGVRGADELLILGCAEAHPGWVYTDLPTPLGAGGEERGVEVTHAIEEAEQHVRGMLVRRRLEIAEADLEQERELLPLPLEGVLGLALRWARGQRPHRRLGHRCAGGDRPRRVWLGRRRRRRTAGWRRLPRGRHHGRSRSAFELGLRHALGLCDRLGYRPGGHHRDQEACVGAEVHHVAVVQLRLRHLQSVDERAVAAAVVPDPDRERAVVFFERRVRSRDALLVQADRRHRGAADGHAPRSDGEAIAARPGADQHHRRRGVDVDVVETEARDQIGEVRAQLGPVARSCAPPGHCALPLFGCSTRRSRARVAT